MGVQTTCVLCNKGEDEINRLGYIRKGTCIPLIIHGRVHRFIRSVHSGANCSIVLYLELKMRQVLVGVRNKILVKPPCLLQLVTRQRQRQRQRGRNKKKEDEDEQDDDR